MVGTSVSRGRPPLSPEGTTDVHFRVPNDLYDAADAQARRERATQADIFRKAIRNYVTENSDTSTPVRP